MITIVPSLLASDFSKLADEVRAVAEAGADWIHIDVMDGHFVPNLTVGPFIVEAVRRITTLPLDVHLMIDNPDDFLDDFASAGADYLSVHVEVLPHLQHTLQAIRDKGMKPGAALNPSTPLSTLTYVLDDLDLVLIMTVNPGFGGQAFIPACLDKIRHMRDMIAAHGRSIYLEVDGGIKPDNIADVAAAGADAFVSGTGIFGTPDYRETISKMRRNVTRRLGRARSLRARPQAAKARKKVR
jgi:ribulose-phosphate 3-epimerase